MAYTVQCVQVIHRSVSRKVTGTVMTLCSRRVTGTVVCFQEGTTPLILAVANNHMECVRELLKQGADPSARRLVCLFFLSILMITVTLQWNRPH